jgi:hypothetical protein
MSVAAVWRIGCHGRHAAEVEKRKDDYSNLNLPV